MPEQRRLERKPFNHAVRLFKNNVLMAMGYAENLSEQGMFIKTDCLMYPKDSSIEVVFTSDDKKTMRLLATVVHRSVNGLGVKFPVS